MKSLKYIIAIIIITLTAACTKVVDVDVPEAPPRLVVDASINWAKGTLGNEQVIKLSTSTPYFDNNTFVPAIGASVKITNTTDLTEFVFIDAGNGNYTINSFIPSLNQEYKLEIIYNGDIYNATEVLTPVSDIANVTQEEGDGFDEDETIVEIFFLDSENETNFYYASFETPSIPLVSLETIDDEFSNGNEMSLEFEGEIEVGETLEINLYGISEGYFNFLDLLIEQAGGDGGPFPTTSSEVKGNCINTSNPDNYAFGYFRLSEVSQTTYTIN